MVKAPEYQTMDDARQWEIPASFEKYATQEYKLKRVEPTINEEKDGPLPRPEFSVYDENGKLIAVFHPYGSFKCYDEKFQEIYDKMVQDIEKAAQKAYDDYMKNR